MADIKMKAVGPQDSTKVSILTCDSGNVCFKSDGANDLVCGHCDTKMATGINPGQITNIFFRCPDCGGYSTI
jgi:hypothetical protein